VILLSFRFFPVQFPFLERSLFLWNHQFSFFLLILRESAVPWFRSPSASRVTFFVFTIFFCRCLPFFQFVIPNDRALQDFLSFHPLDSPMSLRDSFQGFSSSLLIEIPSIDARPDRPF